MQTAPDTDTWPGELVRRFRKGDGASLHTLMAQFGPAVHRAARRHVRTKYDVEDAAQETWLAFITHADDIREPERVVGWLRSTASNVARRMATRNARAEPVDHDSLPCPSHTFEDEVDDGAVRRTRCTAVGRAVEQLSNDERRLVALLIDERRLSYDTISTLAARPIGSIGPSRARVIDKIRRHPGVRGLLSDDHGDFGSPVYQTAAAGH
jgi:RNA polymerase sigma factor (sigma-70 family)